MAFSFKITIYQQDYRLKATRIWNSKESEIWNVISKNKYLVYDCDRPSRVSQGEGHLKWTWKLMDGEITNWVSERITEAMSIEIRRLMKEGKL